MRSNGVCATVVACDDKPGLHPLSTVGGLEKEDRAAGADVYPKSPSPQKIVESGFAPCCRLTGAKAVEIVRYGNNCCIESNGLLKLRDGGNCLDS